MLIVSRGTAIGISRDGISGSTAGFPVSDSPQFRHAWVAQLRGCLIFSAFRAPWRSDLRVRARQARERGMHVIWTRAESGVSQASLFGLPRRCFAARQVGEFSLSFVGRKEFLLFEQSARELSSKRELSARLDLVKTLPCSDGGQVTGSVLRRGTVLFGRQCWQVNGRRKAGRSPKATNGEWWGDERW